MRINRDAMTETQKTMLAHTEESLKGVSYHVACLIHELSELKGKGVIPDLKIDTVLTQVETIYGSIARTALVETNKRFN